MLTVVKGLVAMVMLQELAQPVPLSRAQVDHITDVVHTAPQWYPGGSKEIRVCHCYPPSPSSSQCDDYRILLLATRKLRRKLKP